MNPKKGSYRLAAIIVIITTVILMPAGNFYGKENRKLPPLIQTTTLEGDYKALAGLELAVTPVLSGEDGERAFENILCSCVRIQTREHYGSGSIYKMLENEMIIVTNRHVLQDFDKDSYVTFFNGAAGFGEVFYISDRADVGFIRIPTASFPYEELLTFRNIRLRGKEDDEKGKGQEENLPVSGSEIFCVDMANHFTTPVMKRGELISASVYLDDFGTEMLYGNGSAEPGMSGSGVFDGFGNYLGMLTGATGQGEIAAVPADTVRVEYEKAKKTGLHKAEAG
ncbi:MAG: serine protease [Lachnospiraceae bacterium]|nr:serine protease [Lachnospiraceae bacterium]